MASKNVASLSLPSIEELNALSVEEFFKVVSLLFEVAPPLASALVEGRPFRSYEQLIDYGEHSIACMDLDNRLMVINAHPRIGANPSIQKLSVLSYKEQGYDRDQFIELEKMEKIFAELNNLNTQYEKKFGFKFVVFVNGRSKEEIIPIFRERLNHESRELELQLGLKEMFAIARDRLKKLQTDH